MEQESFVVDRLICCDWLIRYVNEQPLRKYVTVLRLSHARKRGCGGDGLLLVDEGAGGGVSSAVAGWASSPLTEVDIKVSAGNQFHCRICLETNARRSIYLPFRELGNLAD
uniref:Uncharacterized protein n=1 Tax=Oryza meridionalis TaxID=40149 RepID=A0A0E0FEV4_9ORYZ